MTQPYRDPVPGPHASQEGRLVRTPSSALDHELGDHLKDLAKFKNTPALQKSSLYQRLEPTLSRVLHGLDSGDFRRSSNPPAPRSVKALAWNLHRGIRLNSIMRALDTHPLLRSSDLLMLTELDYGMARSSNLHVTREIAARLGLTYVFAPCYLALTKGSGWEAHAHGNNTHSLHGNALLSKYPLLRAHALALPNGRDKLKGSEKRLGSQRAVVADVDHPFGEFRAVTVHLDAHVTQQHRRSQMLKLLEHLEQLDPKLPVIVGGDWNTTTHDGSSALRCIQEYPRRILMGVQNVIVNHYSHPHRWFERHLFSDVERYGYDYRSFNVSGVGTWHYSVDDLAANAVVGEWMPGWFLWPINRSLRRVEGRCSLKLDWFAGRNLRVDDEGEILGPTIVPGLKDDGIPLSDHDPILVSFRISQ